MIHCLHFSISKKYYFEFAYLNKIRKFKDGITFFDFKINLDLYKCSHCPKFELQFEFFNCVIFSIWIYNKFDEVLNEELKGWDRISDESLNPYNVDDKSKGLCRKCKKITMGTLKQKEYHYKGKIIQDVLQLFCDECGSYMGKPYQSSVKIAETLKNL